MVHDEMLDLGQAARQLEVAEEMQDVEDWVVQGAGEMVKVREREGEAVVGEVEVDGSSGGDGALDAAVVVVNEGEGFAVDVHEGWFVASVAQRVPDAGV